MLLTKEEVEYKAATVKFGSGLTYNEAEYLVDAYMKSIEGMSPEGQISLLKNHLTRAVREYDMERKIISAIAAG